MEPVIQSPGVTHRQRYQQVGRDSGTDTSSHRQGESDTGVIDISDTVVINSE